jgi:hypothetical protein
MHLGVSRQGFLPDDKVLPDSAITLDADQPLDTDFDPISVHPCTPKKSTDHYVW